MKANRSSKSSLAREPFPPHFAARQDHRRQITTFPVSSSCYKPWQDNPRLTLWDHGFTNRDSYSSIMSRQLPQTSGLYKNTDATTRRREGTGSRTTKRVVKVHNVLAAGCRSCYTMVPSCLHAAYLRDKSQA